MFSPKKSSLVVASLVLTLAAAWARASETPQYPDHVMLHGRAVDANGVQLDGEIRVELRYLAAANGHSSGPAVLAHEEFSGVEASRGHFEIVLGKGRLELVHHGELRDLFSENPVIDVEVTIDSVAHSPLVRILPAGHSPESAAILAGLGTAAETGPHSKGYTLRRSSTAVQAVVLSPVQEKAPSRPPVRRGDRWTNPFEINVSYLGESPRLKDLPSVDLSNPRPYVPREINRPRDEDLFDEQGRRYGTSTSKIRDPLVERSQTGGASTAPSPILNWEGLSVAVNPGVVPPDPESTVGPNHYIQVVNIAYAVFDKSGSGVPIAGPFATNVLWTGTSSACETDNSGDAIFLYDEEADRYVLTQFAVDTALAVCFAISTTPDPTGTYYRYQVDAQRFPDYFKIGVWPVAGEQRLLFDDQQRLLKPVRRLCDRPREHASRESCSPCSVLPELSQPLHASRC